VPETYVIARGGKVLKKHTGPLSEKDAAELAQLAR